MLNIYFYNCLGIGYDINLSRDGLLYVASGDLLMFIAINNPLLNNCYVRYLINSDLLQSIYFIIESGNQQLVMYHTRKWSSHHSA